MNSRDISVEVQGVSKSFGSVIALNSVSLNIFKGEFFSLLGPSGCGKTTLLRMIGGFEVPDDGSILIEGSDTSGLPPPNAPCATAISEIFCKPACLESSNCLNDSSITAC